MKSIIVRCRLAVRNVTRFITEDVWEMNIPMLRANNEISKGRVRLVHFTKVIKTAIDTFTEESIGVQSVALSYFCTMAIIPFMAVAFAITNGFGLSGILNDFLYSLDIEQDIIDWIMGSANTIIEEAQSGVFGFLSALAFIWLILWMMNRVEKVFNNVWRVRKPENRNFWKSLLVDIGILVLSPFVIIIFFSGTVMYSHVLDIFPKFLGLTEAFRSFLGWVIFYVIIVMVLSVMYKYIPAAKVKYKYAFRAAAIAGLAFTVLQFLYLETQVMVMRINAVYGMLAIIPLFMVWLRMGWLFVLLGAQFSYSIQTNYEQEAEDARLLEETLLVEE